MASNPGFLTHSPWKSLGSFKYVILAPWAIHSIHSMILKEESERDYTNFMVLLFMLWRILHSQIWISISRHRTSKGNNRIVDKGIEFDQVDRESNWDDQILLSGIVFYIINLTMEGASRVAIWKIDGIIITILLHIGPVEFLYYWFHRALHHHYLYSRYHSHHHSSIVTQPISSVVHPFTELVAYLTLFAIPIMTTIYTKTVSLVGLFGYGTFIDFMNNMGHCNFEMVPLNLFSILPPLKYLMYTPTFHSLHHTQFRTNYSLFMPIYDYIYGTMDQSTDTLYETSLKRQEDSPDVVHLTHLTTPDSIYHHRLGFSTVASNPHTSKWYLWLMWPVTFWSTIMTSMYGGTFVADMNTFENLKLQSWAIPIFNRQYSSKWKRESTNRLIEKAILDAEARGTKVLSLGLLNQGEELNRNGELYIKRNPKLKMKVVDGSSLAAAIVINNIPKGTTQILLRGKLCKISKAIAISLCQRGIQVATLYEEEYEELKLITTEQENNSLLISKDYSQKVWLVGDGVREEEEEKAPKGTIFIPFSTFPPKKIRIKDCFYHYTPSMFTPLNLQNLHSCENWLPRRVMSAARVAGIVHALEGWNEHECGDTIFDLDQIWKATLNHGFKPIDHDGKIKLISY